MLIYLKALERLAKTAGLSREEVSSLLREAGGGITAEDIKKVSNLTEAIRRLAKELEERQE
jgi:predicted transcriptional regulator